MNKRLLVVLFGCAMLAAGGESVHGQSTESNQCVQDANAGITLYGKVTANWSSKYGLPLPDLKPAQMEHSAPEPVELEQKVRRMPKHAPKKVASHRSLPRHDISSERPTAQGGNESPEAVRSFGGPVSAKRPNNTQSPILAKGPINAQSPNLAKSPSSGERQIIAGKPTRSNKSIVANKPIPSDGWGARPPGGGGAWMAGGGTGSMPFALESHSGGPNQGFRNAPSSMTALPVCHIPNSIFGSHYRSFAPGKPRFRGVPRSSIGSARPGYPSSVAQNLGNGVEPGPLAEQIRKLLQRANSPPAENKQMLEQTESPPAVWRYSNLPDIGPSVSGDMRTITTVSGLLLESER